MAILKAGKDGGKESTVWGIWFPEFKKLFSICFLVFYGKSREAYHTHAFNCWSWVLRGKLVENMLDGRVVEHRASIWPVKTYRDTFHKVDSVGTTYVISFRGPWQNHWYEFVGVPPFGSTVRLTNGRVVDYGGG